jgi:hypothetical protein
MTNLIQATAGARPVFKLSGDDFGVEFNVAANPQYLVGDIPAGLPGAANYTFALWYMRRGNPAEFVTSPPIFQVSVNDGSTATGGGLAYRSNGTTFRFSTATTDPTDGPLVNLSSIADNTWVHLAGVCEGSAARIYLNGALVNSNTTGVAMPADMAAYRVSIGAARDGSRPSPMRASNLQIWNIALTEQQVNDWAMERLPAASLPSGLIGYWPL